jgi:hypothetical protein
MQQRLRVMKRDERQVVHELAEHYGQATAAAVVEMRRGAVEDMRAC